MCYPVSGPARPAPQPAPAPASKRRWAVVQLARRVRGAGAELRQRVRHHASRAGLRVRRAQRWALSLSLAQLAVPLLLAAFLLLLHPHREIQLGVTTAFVMFAFAFFLLTRAEGGERLEAEHGSGPVVVPSAPLFYSLLQPALPALSRSWGALTAAPLPALVPLYSSLAGCDPGEAEHELSHYTTVSQFFTRRLRPGARPICSASPLVSPADGALTYCGPLEGSYTHPVKGIQYSLPAFLGGLATIPGLLDTQANTNDDTKVDTQLDTKLDTQLDTPQHHEKVQVVVAPCTQLLLSRPRTVLYESIVYLSPADYHRFHSPADWTVLARRHLPGKLYSVSPRLVRRWPALLTTNERVAWLGRWQHGTFALVAVAATNVGDIRADWDPDLATNTATTARPTEKRYEKPVKFSRGQEFGYFNFGSTIVLIYEAPFDMKFKNATTTKIKMGQSLLV